MGIPKKSLLQYLLESHRLDITLARQHILTWDDAPDSEDELERSASMFCAGYTDAMEDNEPELRGGTPLLEERYRRGYRLGMHYRYIVEIHAARVSIYLREFTLNV